MGALYPAMLALDGSTCVVVGGGEVATRKVVRLLECGARVAVVTPSCSQILQDLAGDGAIHVVPRLYREGDLAGASLVFAATSSRQVNAAVASEARNRGILVNVADNPTLSTFQVPALVERDGLRLAISTGGRSPAFARRLREEIELFLSPERLALFELYSDLRASLAEAGQQVGGKAWASADQQALRLLKGGRRAEARQVLLAQITTRAPGQLS